MPERRGFWSERPRAGREDARLLAVERLHALRQCSYAALGERADRVAAVEEVTGPSGERFERRTSVKRLWRGGAEELAVCVQVRAPTLLGRLSPLAEELVIATPEGGMVYDDGFPGES
jgi:hypothetical protein